MVERSQFQRYGRRWIGARPVSWTAYRASLPNLQLNGRILTVNQIEVSIAEGHLHARPSPSQPARRAPPTWLPRKSDCAFRSFPSSSLQYSQKALACSVCQRSVVAVIAASVYITVRAVPLTSTSRHSVQPNHHDTVVALSDAHASRTRAKRTSATPMEISTSGLPMKPSVHYGVVDTPRHSNTCTGLFTLPVRRTIATRQR